MSSPFAVTETAAMHDLIDAYGFGTVVSAGPAGLAASHVPCLLDRGRGRLGTLAWHLARTNPQTPELVAGAEVLATFLGPHAYVSPSWYAAAHAVPTWNYAAVQVRGRVRSIDDTATLLDLVSDLSARHERGRVPAWSPAGLPRAMLLGLLKHIVGFELEIERLEGKHKLGQNRSAADRRGVIAALADSAAAGDRAVADYMRRHAPAGD